MTIVEHIQELRRRLVLALAGIAVGTVVGFIWYQTAFTIGQFRIPFTSVNVGPVHFKSLGELLKDPYCQLPPEMRLGGGEGAECRLLATSPFEMFMLRLKVGALAGLVMSSPWWLYQIWAYITPGLVRKERRTTRRVVTAAALLFVMGSVLAYYVVAIGLASGFLEPLESTSIHLIQMGIGHLLTYFPSGRIDDTDRDEYNRLMSLEFEWVRDFIILHYKATERTDSPFWNYCRTMEIPEPLAHRMRLFESHGRVHREGNELFTKISWLQVMHGQRIRPRSYHPLVDLLPEDEIQEYLEEVERVIATCVDVMPSHAQFIAENCAAGRG